MRIFVACCVPFALLRALLRALLDIPYTCDLYRLLTCWIRYLQALMVYVCVYGNIW